MSDEAMRAFGETARRQLVGRRTQLGMTQQQVADAMGTARSNVAMYESRKLTGPLWFVFGYAQAVGYELTLKYQGPPGVVKSDGKWTYEGIVYGSRAEARRAMHPSQ